MLHVKRLVKFLYFLVCFHLQKAIMGFDKEQYHMVSEALQERANLVDIAPHLAYALPIMLPVYTYWQIPYFWAGIKVGRVRSSTANSEAGNFVMVNLVWQFSIADFSSIRIL